LQSYGYDNDNSAAFWMVLSTSLLQIFIQTWSWLPFEADYEEKNEMLEEREFENARTDYEIRLAEAGADDEYSPEYSPENFY
jgi:hypothetical protein